MSDTALRTPMSTGDMALTSTRLPVAPGASEREKLSAAAKQFEAIFLREMLSAARKTDFGGDVLGGGGMDTFRQMQDEHFADIAAKTGTIGMAAIIEAQLARQLAPQSTAPAASDTNAGGS